VAVLALAGTAAMLAPAAAQGLDRHQGVVLSTTVAPTAYYAAPMRNAAGRIDAAGTLTGILAHGARNYEYLLANRWGNHSAQDWADLPGFLDLAARWHVKVTITLLPPTEASTPVTGRWYGACDSGQYPPFNGSYDRWFTAIGQLARTHPALVGSGMDDYPLNVNSYCKSFQPTTPSRWQRLQNTAAGRTLTFAPTIYYYPLTSTRMDLVTSGQLTSVVWPFDDVNDTRLLAVRYAAIKKRYPNLRITVMIFAQPANNRPTPTAASVDAQVRAARAVRPAGIVVYSQYVARTTGSR
jgi:hypothetical protein